MFIGHWAPALVAAAVSHKAPRLGTLFIAANPLAGLDWPVRLLVLEDEKGDVWAAYTDFSYIAKRHAVNGADAEAFSKASGVIASITSSVKAQ